MAVFANVCGGWLNCYVKYYTATHFFIEEKWQIWYNGQMTKNISEDSKEYRMAKQSCNSQGGKGYEMGLSVSICCFVKGKAVF